MSSVLVINKPSNRKEKTIVIIGSARSGTSLLAGAFHHGGISFTKAKSHIYECPQLCPVLEKHDWKKLGSLIEARNEETVWGWKRPSIINAFDEVTSMLRNPIIITIMRDVTAIALRNKIAYEGSTPSTTKALVSNMKINLAIQKKTIESPINKNLPLCIVSAEKMFKNPMQVIDDCADFAGVNLDREKIQEFLKLGNDAYLKQANNK